MEAAARLGVSNRAKSLLIRSVFLNIDKPRLAHAGANFGSQWRPLTPHTILPLDEERNLEDFLHPLLPQAS